MKPGRGSVWIALLAAFALILSACGDGDDAAEDTESTEDTAAETAEEDGEAPKRTRTPRPKRTLMTTPRRRVTNRRPASRSRSGR